MGYFLSHHIFWCRFSVLTFLKRTHTIFHFTGATLLQELQLNKLYIFQYQTYKCSEVKRESCHSNSGFSAYYLSKYKVYRLVSSLSSGTALEEPRDLQIICRSLEKPYQRPSIWETPKKNCTSKLHTFGTVYCPSKTFNQISRAYRGISYH